MKQPTPEPKRSRLTWLKKKADKRLFKLLLWQLITAIVTGLIVWRVFVWYQTNTIVFRPPVRIEWFTPVRLVNRVDYQQEVEMTKTLAEIKEKALYNYQHPETLPKCDSSVMEKIDPQKFWDIIFLYESTNDTSTTGLNAYCKAKGKSNPIGYSPSTKFCFNSLEEAKIFVPFWLSHNAYGLTMNQALCKWNEGDPDKDGVIRGNCPYALGKLSEAN